MDRHSFSFDPPPLYTPREQPSTFQPPANTLTVEDLTETSSIHSAAPSYRSNASRGSRRSSQHERASSSNSSSPLPPPPSYTRNPTPAAATTTSSPSPSSPHSAANTARAAPTSPATPRYGLPPTPAQAPSFVPYFSPRMCAPWSLAASPASLTWSSCGGLGCVDYPKRRQYENVVRRRLERVARGEKSVGPGLFRMMDTSSGNECSGGAGRDRGHVENNPLGNASSSLSSSSPHSSALGNAVGSPAGMGSETGAGSSSRAAPTTPRNLSPAPTIVTTSLIEDALEPRRSSPARLHRSQQHHHRDPRPSPSQRQPDLTSAPP